MNRTHSESAPNDERLAAMIKRGEDFVRCGGDDEAEAMLAALHCLARYRKALREIAAGDGYYGAMACEYKRIAKAALAEASNG